MRILVALACLAPAIALAEPEAPQAGFAPHVNAGVEIMGGPRASSAAFRGHIGIDQSLGRQELQPMIGLGATLGAGALVVSDPRGLDGSVSLGYLDYGPELQLGVRWVNGGMVDSRLFASLAYVHTELDDRLMLDPIAGVGGTNGVRATLGFNWADRQLGHDSSGDRHEFGWLMVFVPQQVEVGWERSAGSDRGGVTLGWGI